MKNHVIRIILIIVFCYCVFLPAIYGVTYYVSKNGNNAGATSWATAWNELGSINWPVIQPGDTILIDGGSSQMVYATALSVGKSGTSANPITVRLADESGRNGQAVIFGGRSTPLPYCGQTDYSYPGGYLGHCIGTSGCSWIIIDGMKWSGILMHGAEGGVYLGDSDNITVRNVEVYDCGYAMNQSGSWVPTSPGVSLSGTNITFERVIVHDNGHDAFQGGKTVNFTLRESRIYNSRTDPTNPGRAFNYCKHPDGIQIWAGGESGPFLIEDCVFGPGFMQGVFLGGTDSPVNSVAIRHTLFYKNTPGSNICGNTAPRNWTIENVTSYDVQAGVGYNLYLEGTGHTAANSIFYGSYFMFPHGTPSFSGNYQWNVSGGVTIGTVANPMFVNAGGDDYALQSGSPAAGKGSRVTSVAKLFELFPDEGAVPSAGSLRFGASTYNVNENGGSAVITVSRQGGTAGAVSVQYATSNGTAQSAVDYTAKSGIINWASGDNANKTFTIGIINDTGIENSETINITLSNPAGGASLGTPGAAVLAITDNDIITTDTTPPSKIAEVRDGALPADIDSIPPGTELSANWDASSDYESGVVKYWYAIGTTAGGTNVINWTDNGTARNVTKTGLTLQAGTIYYFTVKAENGVGLQSDPASSDGQSCGPAVPEKVEITVRHQNLCRVSGGSSVKFRLSGVVGNSELRIYTITGKAVRTLDINSGVNEIDWALVNESGGRVKPGIYLYTILDSNKDKKTGKIVIAR